MNAYEEMQNFVRVVEAGSISKAAEQLGLAKSGVSRRLAELEKRLAELDAHIAAQTAREERLTAEWEEHELDFREISGNVRLAARDRSLCINMLTASRRYTADSLICNKCFMNGH